MPKNLSQLYNLVDDSTPPLFLAPMAGFTDAPMRRISRDYGADLTFTEMVNDMGVLRAEPKTLQLLARLEGEKPVVAHLYGSDPATLAEAAGRVESAGGFAGIDLNAGCPVHKVTRGGAGAALIKDPSRIFRILAAMRRSVTLPLTVKTRLGPHPGKTAIFDILRAAEDAGADAITVHARFTSQGHGGNPDLDLLAEVKRRAAIPVIGNGGIRSDWDARQMRDKTGVDALMIARSAIGNPWIFGEIRRGLLSQQPPPMYEPTRGRAARDLHEIRSLLQRHLNDQEVFLQETRRLFSETESEFSIANTLAMTFRCHLFRYLAGLKGSSYLRSRLNEFNSVDQMLTAVDDCIERERVFRANRPPL